MADEYYWHGLCQGLCLGAGSVVLLSVSLTMLRPMNHFPRTEKVEKGFIIPSKLEIKVDELKNNGKNQTILNYDGKSYLFTLDESGRPQIQDYEIVPAKTRPAEIQIKSSPYNAEKP